MSDFIYFLRILIQDFQRVLFGSRHTEEIQTDIAKLLALPIDPRDVIRMGLDENLNAAVRNLFVTEFEIISLIVH